MSLPQPSVVRISALDTLRGFALSGILFVNIGPLVHFSATAPQPVSMEDPSGWLQLFVQQRFFVIFSLLFGIGFTLIYRSAAKRTTKPRVALLRRLLVLLPLGLLHQLLQPGEALAIYAVVGLIILLPSTWLPRVVVAGLASVGVTTGVAVGGGILLVPGMFLLGSALTRYGAIDRIAPNAASRFSTARVAGWFVLLAVASLPAMWWQQRDVAGAGITLSSTAAGITMAGTYVFGLLLVLRTPLRVVLEEIFAPLGRLALTHYVGATLLIVAVDQVTNFSDGRNWTLLLATCVSILMAQWIFSILWLRAFTQGPLEWLWRWATWLERPAFLRQTRRRQVELRGASSNGHDQTHGRAGRVGNLGPLLDEHDSYRLTHTDVSTSRTVSGPTTAYRGGTHADDFVKQLLCIRVALTSHPQRPVLAGPRPAQETSKSSSAFSRGWTST